MSFVRAKKIKDKHYAYLVCNIWSQRKVRQKVKKYLGRIIDCSSFTKVVNTPNMVDFSGSQKDALQSVVSFYFQSLGFTRKNSTLIFKDYSISLSKGHIRRKNKPVVLLTNGRYLYDGLLRKLLFFNQPENQDKQKGEQLAQLFSDCGISISQEHFILLYKKIYG